MRGTVDSLPIAHPLGAMMPSLYQEDRFAQSLTAGLDDVLASIFVTLDSLAAYVDPQLAPEDFLDWLAGWVSAGLDETWPLDRRRAFVARAVDIFRQRGTVAGLVAHVEVFSGGSVEIVETGGSAWSPVSNGELPGEPEPRMTVRVTVTDPEALDLRALDALVAAAKPAHVVHSVEIVAR